MMIRGCALLNEGRAEEAERLLARLCVLMPEDTVAQAMYRMARERQEDGQTGEPPAMRERLTTGLDVPRQEASARVSRLISVLYADAGRLREDEREREELCRLAAWAFRSHSAGEQGAVLALMVMGILRTEEARGVLLDALTDPQVADGLKMAILQTLEGMGGANHCDVDIGGQFCRLAAGGVVNRPVRGHVNEIVQRVCDVLGGRFPDAPETVLAMWIPYMERYALPKRERRANAVAAALETLYYAKKGIPVDEGAVSRRWGVSPRLCLLYMRRIRRAADAMQGAANNEEENR